MERLWLICLCDCLQGDVDVPVPFQHLRKIQKKPFQCSAWTTTAGVNAFLEDSVNLQKSLRDRIFLAGFDEAALVLLMI